MLAVLAVIETSDLIFGVDCVPAIFGVTREPFIVVAARRSRSWGSARCTSCSPSCATGSSTSTSGSP